MTEQTINHDFTWPGQPYPVFSGKPADSTLTALSWADVSTATGIHAFDVTSRDGTTRRLVLDKHALHVLDGLMRRPIKSASIPRIGEYVRVLRHEHKVDIHCERYQGNKFGVYHLIDMVERVKAEVAA